MKILLISDTHTKHNDFNTLAFPKADVLIHAGDFTNIGHAEDVFEFDRWLGTLSFKHKIVIAGNHDFGFQRKPDIFRSYITNAVYLEDSYITIKGYKFYGTPWNLRFNNWAFNVDQNGIEKFWDKIPLDTDILITHQPPFYFGDMPTPHSTHLGCAKLLARVVEVKPYVHVYGHIHGGYGITDNDDTIFVNASSLNEQYQLVNSPILIDITKNRKVQKSMEA
jgi:Icc-related predicted phosphoesterase